MKIGYVLEQFPKLSETFILEEMLELERLGLDLTIFTLAGSQDSQVHEKVKLLRAEVVRPSTKVPRLQSFGFVTAVGLKKWFWGMRMSSWLAAEAKRRGIEHLHAHFAGDTAWVALLASKISKIPYSFTAHAGGLFGWPYLLKEKVDGAKFVIAISEFNKKYLGGAGKIKVIHCGIDLSMYQWRQWRQERQCSQILTVARLEEKKGHKYLFEALKILKDKSVNGLAIDKIDFRLTLVGGGLLENSLKEQVRSLGLEDSIVFTGPITQEKVHELLGNADLFVLPCVKAKNGNMDGIPVVLMEAMAVGVPAISTGISGVPELIENGQNGLLVEPCDAEGLAAAIEKILTDKELRRQLIQQARIKVEEEFDVKKNAKRLASILLR